MDRDEKIRLAEQKRQQQIEKMLTGKKGISRGNLHDVEAGFLKKYNFTVGQKVIFGLAKDRFFALDETETWYYFTPQFRDFRLFRIYKVEDILELNIFENNSATIRSSGGAGSAAAESAMKNTRSTDLLISLTVKITTRNTDEAPVKIELLKNKIQRRNADPFLNQADMIFSLLKSVMPRNGAANTTHANEHDIGEANKTHANDNNISEQLEKLSELKSKGELSEEEFAAAKQKLLQ